MDLARAHPTLKCHVVQVMQEDLGSSDILKRLQAIVQELNIDNMVQTAMLSFTPPDHTPCFPLHLRTTLPNDIITVADPNGWSDSGSALNKFLQLFTLL